LVPAHDAQALAEAMRAYATDPQRIIREGREAREAAEREFDVRLVTAAMLKALELPGDPNVD
jgi:glycosyltransferase involved in cell wall biosynthesis